MTNEEIAGLKIVCPVPTYKRSGITIETIKQLQKLAVKPPALAVGI